MVILDCDVKLPPGNIKEYIKYGRNSVKRENMRRKENDDDKIRKFHFVAWSLHYITFSWSSWSIYLQSTLSLRVPLVSGSLRYQSPLSLRDHLSLRLPLTLNYRSSSC